MSEFLHIQQGSGLYSNVAQLKRYIILQHFLIKKIQQDFNYFFSHAFLSNTKSDLSILIFKLQLKMLETNTLNG